MSYYRLSFPNKDTALPLLYDADGNRLYQMYDGADTGIGDGIMTERYTDKDGNNLLRLSSNGEFNVNICADYLPAELEGYEIATKYPKHVWSGE